MTAILSALGLSACGSAVDGTSHVDGLTACPPLTPGSSTDTSTADDLSLPDAAIADIPLTSIADAAAAETDDPLGRGSDGMDANRAPKARAILVSVDGMGGYYVQQQLAQGKLPGFAALRGAGASTFNARADYAYTVTLPNHTSMITGLPVSGDPELPDTAYHGWTVNAQVSSTVTLHNSGNPSLPYIASVFDVVHDHGGATCLYSGKPKFTLFANSYNGKNGAVDRVPPDDGRNKVDRVAIVSGDTEYLISLAEADLSGHVCDFAFVHIADTDTVGHASGWGSDLWLSTLETVDGWIRRLAVFADPALTAEPFYLIVTADHGGQGYDHSDATLPFDYTVPFFLVGPGIAGGTDLYGLVAPNRTDPGVGRPRYCEPLQPVRNADAANLVTSLMGLPPVPGSFMRNLLR